MSEQKEELVVGQLVEIVTPLATFHKPLIGQIDKIFQVENEFQFYEIEVTYPSRLDPSNYKEVPNPEAITMFHEVRGDKHILKMLETEIKIVSETELLAALADEDEQ